MVRPHDRSRERPPGESDLENFFPQEDGTLVLATSIVDEIGARAGRQEMVTGLAKPYVTCGEGPQAR